MPFCQDRFVLYKNLKIAFFNKHLGVWLDNRRASSEPLGGRIIFLTENN